MLAEESQEEEEGQEGSEEPANDFQYGDEDDSEIEEDIKPKKGKKKVEKYSSDSEVEETKPSSKKGVYKANKMNPMIYQDSVDKANKKIQR